MQSAPKPQGRFVFPFIGIALGVATLLWAATGWRPVLPEFQSAAPSLKPWSATMSRPDLGPWEALPSASLAALRPSAERFVDTALSAPFVQLDPLALTYAVSAIEADQKNPSVPVRIPPQEMAAGRTKTGSQILVSGEVCETAPAALGEHIWTRAILKCDGQVYLHLLVRPGLELSVGSSVYCTGRFLGVFPLGKAPAVPTLAIRAAHETKDRRGIIAVQSRYERFSPNPELIKSVNDLAADLEYEAYYQLLGQAVLDASSADVYANPASANELANELHYNGSQHRGQMMTVEGKIYGAWEDSMVAIDRPYGVERVFRLWLVRFDKGLWLYEVAAVVDRDAVLPKEGDSAKAVGRFLKNQAYKVNIDRIRDRENEVVRQSDSVYSKFIVSNGVKITPAPVVAPPPEILPIWLRISLGVIACSLLGWCGFLLRSAPTETGVARSKRKRPGKSDADPGEPSA